MKMPLGRLNCCPLGQEVAVLIEDLNPVVVAIADEQPALRVHRERVRLIEFVGARAVLAPCLDELAVLRELEQVIVAGAVAFGHEDVAVGRDEDGVRLIEVGSAPLRRRPCRASAAACRRG